MHLYRFYIRVYAQLLIKILCFCQQILATIDYPFRARIANPTRFKKAFLVFSHV